MTIEEKKRHYERVQQNRILHMGTMRLLLNQFYKEEISLSKLIEVINEKHLAAMDTALTSLLEELPEVDESEQDRSMVTDYRISGENIYREKIKSLIQTKLK